MSISRVSINVNENKAKAMARYKEKIMEQLSDEPKSPNEIAVVLGIHQKTAQTELMRLALTHSNEVGYKQIGRTHLFWRKAKK